MSSCGGGKATNGKKELKEPIGKHLRFVESVKFQSRYKFQLEAIDWDGWTEQKWSQTYRAIQLIGCLVDHNSGPLKSSRTRSTQVG
jgi:hypothetical protein